MGSHLDDMAQDELYEEWERLRTLRDKLADSPLTPARERRRVRMDLLQVADAIDASVHWSER